MAQKVFQLSSVKNNIHKNGFDLSQSRMFSTAPGIINVCYAKECVPGDKFQISVENLTRTQTLNTAAYARAKEFWNFHFVPFRLLWRYFPDMIIQNSHADTASSPISSSVPSQCPRFLWPQTWHCWCFRPVSVSVASLSITQTRVCSPVSALSPHSHSCQW